ncbi:hypothetical protein EZS27_001369 [termite gut metagenome]|uniref:Uncharacterized protein n=1 Tax=termite gut metagenome TaxID=433724 RepID=A0A5J4T0P6_9ZZZZ
MAKEFMYGLDRFSLNGEDLGYIEEDSFDWGGSEGEVTEIRAAQVKGVPVLVIPKSNGSQKPTFDLIDLSYESLQRVLGGTLTVGAEDKVTGWKAPKDSLMITGEAIIYTTSGQKITIPNAMLQGYISGGLNMTSVSKIKCTLSIMQPAEGEPYTIEDMGEVE